MIEARRNTKNEIGNTVERMMSQKQTGKKLSTPMILILGAIVAAEIIIAGGMVFNIDFRSADLIAIVLIFMVLYFGIVAGLAD